MIAWIQMPNGDWCAVARVPKGTTNVEQVKAFVEVLFTGLDVVWAW